MRQRSLAAFSQSRCIASEAEEPRSIQQKSEYRKIDASETLTGGLTVFSRKSAPQSGSHRSPGTKTRSGWGGERLHGGEVLVGHGVGPAQCSKMEVQSWVSQQRGSVSHTDGKIRNLLESMKQPVDKKKESKGPVPTKKPIPRPWNIGTWRENDTGDQTGQ